MQTETTQAITVVSIPMLLILGWTIAAVVLGYGWLKQRMPVARLGFALVGLMTLVTPLAWYAYAAGRPDLYPIGVGDLLLLALLAFVGGGVVAWGLALPRWRPSAAAKR